MFTLERHGPPPCQPRLLAPAGMSVADFDKLAQELGSKPMRAHKTGFVSARRAARAEHVETRWNGKESSDDAAPDDFIVTSLSVDRKVLHDASGHANTYVVRASRFAELYKRDQGANEFGDIYRSLGSVDALYLAAGFEMLAPWGQPQRADAGYVIRNGEEVFGNNKETFEQTYVQIR